MCALINDNEYEPEGLALLKLQSDIIKGTKSWLEMYWGKQTEQFCFLP